MVGRGRQGNRSADARCDPASGNVAGHWTARPGPTSAWTSARGRSSSISKVCGSSARPASRNQRTTRLRRTRCASVDRLVVEPAGELHPAARRPQPVEQSSPPLGGRERRRRLGAERDVEGLRQVALGSSRSRSAPSSPAASCSPALSASAAAPASSRPLAGSSSPEVASSIATSARRTSWPSSVARAPSTRWCSRSSRAAVKDRYHGRRRRRTAATSSASPPLSVHRRASPGRASTAQRQLGPADVRPPLVHARPLSAPSATVS